jgi:hypothetical protein
MGNQVCNIDQLKRLSNKSQWVYGENYCYIVYSIAGDGVLTVWSVYKTEEAANHLVGVLMKESPESEILIAESVYNDKTGLHGSVCKDQPETGDQVVS